MARVMYVSMEVVAGTLVLFEVGVGGGLCDGGMMMVGAWQLWLQLLWGGGMTEGGVYGYGGWRVDGFESDGGGSVDPDGAGSILVSVRKNVPAEEVFSALAMVAREGLAGDRCIIKRCSERKRKAFLIKEKIVALVIESCKIYRSCVLRKYELRDYGWLSAPYLFIWTPLYKKKIVLDKRKVIREDSIAEKDVSRVWIELRFVVVCVLYHRLGLRCCVEGGHVLASRALLT
ncbi:hypothetical protein Tco_1063563 [Tanacetum coccineum]